MQGKSFLTAIFAVAKAILYPNVQIIIAAGQKSQAKDLFDKIVDLRNRSSTIQREIKEIKSSANDQEILFHNGSWIKTVTASDGARGKRANVLIVDEFRMVDKDIIDTVLRRFASNPRFVGYINKEPYKSMSDEEKLQYMDRNQELYLSSAFFKSHESWDRVKDYAKNMIEEKPYFVCQLPYQLPIKEGLLDSRQVRDEMSESSFNEIKWLMEMEAMFFGESMNSYFKLEEIQRNRTLKKVYYPKRLIEQVRDKSLALPKKQHGELRVISADIATMGGAENDASIYTVARLIPDTDSGYERQIIYMEDVVGGHTETQAIRIRELYEDFDCDYIVLDVLNAGLGVYDAMTRELVNPDTGEVYQPVSCLNDERFASRCTFPRAPKIVYAMQASQSLNSKIASGFKDSLRRGKIRFPVDEGDAIDIVTRTSGYKNLSPDIQGALKNPYIQATLMQTEILNLEKEINNLGQIRLTEPRSGRKDRYSSVSYLDYFVTDYLELERRRKNKPVIENFSKFFMGKKAKLY